MTEDEQQPELWTGDPVPHFDGVDGLFEAEPWEFHVIGQPVPKGRPRFDPRSRRAYTPKRTVAYEKDVATLAAIRRPALWPLSARYELELLIFHGDARKRDGTNVLKSIEDALNGIAWVDDSQIRKATWEDAIDRDNPRVEITITVLEQA